MREGFNLRINYGILIIFSSLLFFPSCVSHLKEAKLSYAEGQRFSREYDEAKAVACYRRARKEAEIEALKNPSAQAYMLKGMSELKLALFEEAEESFCEAFNLGFEKGEEWAEQVSLLGLASSLEELGLKEASFKIYSFLLERSSLIEILLPTSQKHLDFALREALEASGKEREKLLVQVLKTVEKLKEKKMSCGYFHYLESQVQSHLSDFRKSLEEAILAKELGLPNDEVRRDNDLQIVFCYQRLKTELSSEEWEEFNNIYLRWIKKWKWENPEKPEWKKREKE